MSAQGNRPKPMTASPKTNLRPVFDQIIQKSLRPIALGLGLYYAALGVARAFIDEPGAHTMLIIAGSSAAALFGLYIALKWKPVPVSWAHAVEGGIGAVVLFNCLAHIQVVADLKQTSNVALAIIGGGLLFLSPRWLTIFLTAAWGGWLLVTWQSSSNEWIHYFMMLFTSTVICVLVHGLRVRGLRQLESTRVVLREMELRRKAEEESKKLEAQLHQAEKLKSLGILAGGIAHDFNNILVPVLGYSELALEEVGEDSPVRIYLDQISAAANRAAELTNQMLAYAGKGRFTVEPVNVSDVVSEMVELLKASVSKKATLRLDLSDNLPLIEADITQVRQIILNLVTNANEALGENTGVITVKTGVMKVTSEHVAGAHLKNEDLVGHESVYLEVADTGCGMDKRTRPKIFDPFFTTKFKGRGLGLAAVLGIVKTQGGAIQVETEPRKGTCVTVWFRNVQKAALSTTEAAPDDPFFQANGAVLVVDDEEHVRAVIRRVLEKCGFLVRTAADGSEAVDLFRSHRSEIVFVVLDLTMPKMGGEEVFRELQRTRPGTAVILMSGYDEDDVMSRFAGRGPTAFLHKPFAPNDLLTAVRKVFKSGRRGSSASAS